MIETKQSFISSRFLLLISTFAVILAFILSASTLNLFINYTTPGGMFYEKFHPYVYVLFGGYLVCLFSNSVQAKTSPQLVAMTFFCIFLILFLIINGKLSYAVVVVNNYWAPLILFSFILTFSESSLNKISKVFLILTVAQAIITIIEFYVGTTFLPVTQEKAYFRPAGLAGHPLNAGLIAVLGLLATRDFIKNYFVSRTLLLLFLGELLILGVRGSLIFAALILIFELIFPKSINRNATFRMLDSLFFASIILAVFGAINYGALDRFIALGIWDGSAQSRLKVFDLLKILNSEEFRSGVSYDRIGLYLEHLRLNYIESPFITHVVIGGLGFAIATHAFLGILILYIGKYSKFLAVAMLFYLVTTLSFSAKTPLLLLFTLLAAVNQTYQVKFKNRELPF